MLKKRARRRCARCSIPDDHSAQILLTKHTEGFFGLLKQEFFHGRDWSGVGAAEFSAALDEWMRWFRSGRISQALGWLTPDERRLALGYAV